MWVLNILIPLLKLIFKIIKMTIKNLIKIILGGLLLVWFSISFTYLTKKVSYCGTVIKKIDTSYLGGKHGNTAYRRLLLDIKTNDNYYITRDVTVSTYYNNAVGEQVCFTEDAKIPGFYVLGGILGTTCLAIFFIFLIYNLWCYLFD